MKKILKQFYLKNCVNLSEIKFSDNTENIDMNL